MMKSVLMCCAAVLTLAGCGAQSKGKDEAGEKGRGCLVLYYSQTGATKAVAQEFARQLQADVAEIVVEQPYDGDFAATLERSRKETDGGNYPALKPLDVDLSKYETIFLGYPVWFGTYANPIASLAAAVSFEGKTVVPFCTFGSGGTPARTTEIKKALKGATIKPGYGVRNARVAKAPAEVERFLMENGYIGGTVETLPAFSQQQPVTPDETAIFNAACGNYQFPLGTPVTVGKRAIKAGTEYKYAVKSTEGSMTTIYVTVDNAPGSVPEFTEVVS